MYISDSGTRTANEIMSECYTDSYGYFELFYYDKIKTHDIDEVKIISDSFARFLSGNAFGKDVNIKIYLSDSSVYAFYARDQIKNGDRLYLEIRKNHDTILDTIYNPKPGIIFLKHLSKWQSINNIKVSLYKGKQLYDKDEYTGSDMWHRDPDTNKLFFPRY